MEPKKNPKYDVHRQRGTIFQISLVITLALVITAFQWSVPVEKEIVSDPVVLNTSSRFDDIILPTSFKTEEPPKPRDIKPRVLVATEFVPIQSEPINNNTSTPAVDQGEEIDNSTSFGSIELPIEDDTVIFCIVEKMPEPVGGFEGFYRGLSRNLKYPKRASRDEVAGKVYVSFIVNEKSELSDFKILKGIGYGCDEEAIRVISLSKWNAGRQRGRPVKVRMVQTINFQLN